MQEPRLSSEQERGGCAEQRAQLARPGSRLHSLGQRQVPEWAVRLQSRPESIYPGGEREGQEPHQAGPRCGFYFKFIVKGRRFQTRKEARVDPGSGSVLLILCRRVRGRELSQCATRRNPHMLKFSS